MKICRITPHFYEEPEISGTNGSGTIFFSGCSLDCEFCQNYLISKKYVGRIFSPAQLAEAFKKLEKLGVHNINLVTPTHYSEQIRTAIDIYRPSVPIVYNTSGYEKISSLQKMDPYVDIYLTDFKYSNNEIGMKFSKIKNYYDVCFSAVRYMVDRKPLVFEDGLLKKGS